MRAIVDRVIPSIVNIAGGEDRRALASLSAAELGHEHVRHTVSMLQGYSAALAAAVDEGRCAIIGLEYTLADGRVHVAETVGDIGG